MKCLDAFETSKDLFTCELLQKSFKRLETCLPANYIKDLFKRVLNGIPAKEFMKNVLNIKKNCSSIAFFVSKRYLYPVSLYKLYIRINA